MAADESISVEIKDGVDKGVAREINQIATSARVGYQNVEKLVRQLNRIRPGALDQVARTVSNAQRQMTLAATASQKLATETQRTAQAAANAATAQQRLATQTARTAQAETAAAGAALRLEAAQTRAANAADKQAAAQQRAAQASTAQAQALKAQDVEVARIQGIHERFNAVMARSPVHQKNFAAGQREVARTAGLARHELSNLAMQVNDVVVSLGSGQRPMQVFLQQGAQIGQIFGASGAGAGAILRQLAGIVGTLLMRLAPFAAVITAVAAPFALFAREFNKGVDPQKMIAGLKLTEEQLERLKKSGEEARVTFGDTFKATFQVIGRYASQYLGPVFTKIKEWAATALDFVTKLFSTWIRFTIGQWLALANVIKAVWNNIPGSIEYATKTAINKTIGIIEFGINTISNALLSSPLGKLLGISGPVEFKLPRLELSDSARDAGEQITKGFADGFRQADELVTKFGQDVRAQALKNAQDRLKAAAGDADKKGGSSGFNRAKELAAINAQLDMQAKNMFVLATAREAANQADEIALRFQKEGKPLTQSEIDALRNKIQALNDAKDVQQQFDRIYQNAIGPQREYNASLAAADKLLKMGAISQAQYTAEVMRAKDAYSAASDPLYQINKELDEQIKLLGMLGPQREIEQQVMQATNAALQAGKPLREEEISQLREKLKLVQAMNNVSSIRDDLQSNSAAQRSMNRRTKTDVAIGEVGNNGFTGNDAVAQLGQDNPALLATQEYAAAQVAAYQDMYAQIEQLRQADLISEQSAMAARTALFTQQYQQQIGAVGDMFGAIAQLQAANGRKYKRFAIAQAIINTYLSATKALAEVPYPANFVAMGAAIVSGLAQIQQIRKQPEGYKEGGYTGNIPTNSIAGPVHGQEYVFDAAATARIGVGNLEALRSGRVSASEMPTGEASASPAVRGGRGGGTTVLNVTIAGRPNRNTPEQIAKATRTESARQLVRDGG